jgi:membrane protein YdbS with pleckstrin-like domain
LIAGEFTKIEFLNKWQGTNILKAYKLNVNSCKYIYANRKEHLVKNQLKWNKSLVLSILALAIMIVGVVVLCVMKTYAGLIVLITISIIQICQICILVKKKIKDFEHN